MNQSHFFSFRTFSDLLKHLLKMHSKSEYDVTYKQSDQVYHCDRCNEKVFGNIQALKLHFLDTHFHCADCKQDFENCLEAKNSFSYAAELFNNLLI